MILKVFRVRAGTKYFIPDSVNAEKGRTHQLTALFKKKIAEKPLNKLLKFQGRVARSMSNEIVLFRRRDSLVGKNAFTKRNTAMAGRVLDADSSVSISTSGQQVYSYEFYLKAFWRNSQA